MVLKPGSDENHHADVGTHDCGRRLMTWSGAGVRLENSRHFPAKAAFSNTEPGVRNVDVEGSLSVVRESTIGSESESTVDNVESGRGVLR